MSARFFDEIADIPAIFIKKLIKILARPTSLANITQSRDTPARANELQDGPIYGRMVGALAPLTGDDAARYTFPTTPQACRGITAGPLWSAGAATAVGVATAESDIFRITVASDSEIGPLACS